MKSFCPDDAHGLAIPHSMPTLGKAEAEAVAAVIASGQIAQGPVVQRFEKAFAAFCGSTYAAAIGSGTVALQLSLRALGVEPGNDVIVPSFVCAAILNAVAGIGATPVLADIDPATYNIDPVDVARRMTGRTRAIIAPHMFGLPADMKKLLRLGVPVIEDGAQALGASLDGRMVGSMGTAGVFSFYATKVITTGEGGMVVSGSRRLIDAVKDIRSYDRKRSFKVRGNWKMTDMQAAMGLVQLQRLPGFVARRREIARSYDLALRRVGLTPPEETNGRIYYRYIVNSPKRVAAVIRHMKSLNVVCARPVFRPLHRLLHLEGYAMTEKAWRSGLSLPIYPCLSDEGVKTVAHALSESLGL